MPLNLESLSDALRPFMLRELEADVADGSLYLSPRLSPSGQAAFPDLLRKALESGNDAELARNLSQAGLFNATEIRQTKKKAITANIPETAPVTLAEGEFNRFYIRGLCLRLVEAGGGEVQVYRARASSWARPESEALIGTTIDAEALLQDLRSHKGEAPTLLPHVNSGLSVREISD